MNKPKEKCSNCKKRVVVVKGLCKSCYVIKVRDEKEAKQNEQKIKEANFSMRDYICDELIKIFEKPPNVPVWQWTEENIKLPNSEGFQGSQNPVWEYAPEMKEVFADLENPDCREIVLVFSSQSSKTLFEICAMAYLNWKFKATIMFTMPSERLFKRIPRRLKKIYKISPTLGYDDSKGNQGVDFITLNDNSIEFALATSPDSMAERPCQAFVIDEYDEIPAQKLSPYELLKSRVRTFKGRDKRIIASTPKKMPNEVGVMDLYNECKRYEVEMKCPECGEWIVIKHEDLRWNEDDNYSKIRSENLAWAECPKNGCFISDEDHDNMVLNQRWKCLDKDRTEERKGYHKPVWCTIFENWSSCVAAYLEKKQAGIESEADYWNSWAAQPKDLEAHAISYEDLDVSENMHRRKQIPKDVVLLTAGCDIGEEDAWLVVFGWAPNNVVYKIVSERIDITGDDFEKLERALINVEKDLDYLGEGHKPKIIKGCIDSGYKTANIYNICRRMPIWVPVKGNPQTNGQWSISPADPKRRYGDKARGVMLYTINTYYWQDSLQHMLQREAFSNNSLNLPSDTHKRYINHLQNEVKVKVFDKNNREKFIWRPAYKKAPQHLRDASCYANVAGHICSANNMTSIIPEKNKKTTQKHQNSHPNRPLGQRISRGSRRRI